MRLNIMLGTHFNTMGGISAVVNVYRTAGLFASRKIIYIATHRDGSALQKFKLMVVAWLRFMAMLCTARVGLVHVHVSFRASFWRKLLFVAPAIWLGRPVLLHLHSGGFPGFYANECNALGRWVVRWVFSRSTRVVVLSETWAQWVRSITTNPGLRVVYNPVALPPDAGVSKVQRLPARLLYLSRMGERKGTFDLLEAMAKVRADGIDVTLAMGGDGDKAGVEAAILSLGLQGHVQLLGWVRGEQKQRHLDSASVFVLPSYHEGLPMGVLEAMAAGLPIVSTPVGGIPEAVADGAEGFLVQPGDVAALADRLARLASSPELAHRMGAAARAKVSRCFAAGVIVPQLETLYDELLEGAV